MSVHLDWYVFISFSLHVWWCEIPYFRVKYNHMLRFWKTTLMMSVFIKWCKYVVVLLWFLFLKSGDFFYLHNGFSFSLCNLVLARNELELLPVQTVTSTDPLKLNKTSLEVVKLFVPGFSHTAVIFLSVHFLCLYEGQALTSWLSFWLALDIALQTN